MTNGRLSLYWRSVNGVAPEWATGIAYSETGSRRQAYGHLVGPGVRKWWMSVGTDRTPRRAPGGRWYHGNY